jgi:hypothetical protein
VHRENRQCSYLRQFSLILLSSLRKKGWRIEGGEKVEFGGEKKIHHHWYRLLREAVADVGVGGRRRRCRSSGWDGGHHGRRPNSRPGKSRSVPRQHGPGGGRVRRPGGWLRRRQCWRACCRRGLVTSHNGCRHLLRVSEPAAGRRWRRRSRRVSAPRPRLARPQVSNRRRPGNCYSRK